MGTSESKQLTKGLTAKCKAPIRAYALGETSVCLDKADLDEIPSSVAMLKYCRVLSLIDNNITELPDEIGSLKSLRELHLNKNRLVKLPLTLSKMSALTVLDCRSNQLKHLPPAIGKLECLLQLYLDDNVLEDLPMEICQLSKLAGKDEAGKFKITIKGNDALPNALLNAGASNGFDGIVDFLNPHK